MLFQCDDVIVGALGINLETHSNTVVAELSKAHSDLYVILIVAGHATRWSDRNMDPMDVLQAERSVWLFAPKPYSKKAIPLWEGFRFLVSEKKESRTQWKLRMTRHHPSRPTQDDAHWRMHADGEREKVQRDAKV